MVTEEEAKKYDYDCQFCEDGHGLTDSDKLYELALGFEDDFSRPNRYFFEPVYLNYCPRCGRKLEPLRMLNISKEE